MRKQDPNRENTKSDTRQLTFSLIIFLIALASIAAATTAWFSLSDNGRINSLNFDITTGISLKFDLDAHESVDQYVDTLNFSQISSRIQSDLGYNMQTTPLVPVTTTDCALFTYQNGTPSSENSGEYLTFTLHFMGEVNQVVHMSSDNGDDKQGTIITSQKETLPSAMRISFTTDEGSWIYDPGMGDASTTNGNVKTFGLSENDATSNDNNAMFSLTANQDKAVIVHVWLEGTDENCVNEVKGSDYDIALKFKGTDQNNQPITGVSSNSETTQGNSHYEDEVQNEQPQNETLFDRISNSWNSIVNKYQ